MHLNNVLTICFFVCVSVFLFVFAFFVSVILLFNLGSLDIRFMNIRLFNFFGAIFLLFNFISFYVIYY